MLRWQAQPAGNCSAVYMHKQQIFLLHCHMGKIQSLRFEHYELREVLNLQPGNSSIQSAIY